MNRLKTLIYFLPFILLFIVQCGLFKPQKNSVSMVIVEGGTFQMGSNNGRSNEKPVHTVTLSSFSISKYEITNAQYCKFLNDAGVNSNGSYKGIEYIDMDASDCQIVYSGGRFVVESGNENYPVIEVTWYGAKAFCEWVGGRLPTEAEWEYAARGGKYSKGYTYSGSNNPDEVAWYCNNSENPDNNMYGVNGTHIVGQKQANELGIYDMSGNVWEWCSDWYIPTGPAFHSYRVLRGSSWFDNSLSVRCAYRDGHDPGYSYDSIGFRCVQ